MLEIQLLSPFFLRSLLTGGSVLAISSMISKGLFTHLARLKWRQTQQHFTGKLNTCCFIPDNIDWCLSLLLVLRVSNLIHVRILSEMHAQLKPHPCSGCDWIPLARRWTTCPVSWMIWFPERCPPLFVPRIECFWQVSLVSYRVDEACFYQKADPFVTGILKLNGLYFSCDFVPHHMSSTQWMQRNTALTRSRHLGNVWSPLKKLELRMTLSSCLSRWWVRINGFFWQHFLYLGIVLVIHQMVFVLAQNFFCSS